MDIPYGPYDHVPHDYEPDPNNKHPMHTDPMCRLCGKPKNDRNHN